MTIAPADPRLAGGHREHPSDRRRVGSGRERRDHRGDRSGHRRDLAHVPRGAAADVDAAVSAGAEAFPTWRTPAPPNGPASSCGGPS